VISILRSGVLAWAAAGALALPSPLVAQGEDASRVAGRPGELLAAGDTAGAVTLLRERVSEAPTDGRAWLDLGRVLGAVATELESDIDARLEAREALRRAIELGPDDPFALLEYGLILRKQRVGVDALRVLDRAWRTAEARGDSLPGTDRARLHYQLGKIYESWWVDWQGLVSIPQVLEGDWSCRGHGSAAEANEDPTATSRAGRFGSYAVNCPGEWWEMLPHVVPIEDLKEEDRGRMLDHFRRALAADPEHVEAAVALLGHLADAAEWDEYGAVAADLTEAAPDDPRGHLFAGLGLHRRGNSPAAAAHFREGMARLGQDERAVFGDLAALLTPEVRQRYEAMDPDARTRSNTTILSVKDPLYLTAVNERELEHYARVAWAELKFSAPASGTRGWDTDAGKIFIRYGEPVRTLQCCYGGQNDMNPLALARFHYWSYGPVGPNFYFWRLRARRTSRLAEQAFSLAEALSRVLPERYAPVNPTKTHAVPVQVARFRGSRADLVRLEVYAAVPLDSLGVTEGDTLDAGFFLFDAANAPVWTRVHAAPVSERGVALTYRVEVPAASLRYAVETREVGPDTLPRPAARATGTVVTEQLGPGLAISDLLLAESIEPRVEGADTREELRIVPSRGLVFGVADPVHIYFEVYGLDADEDGIASYAAELTVTEVSEERRGVLARVFRGARDLLFGEGDRPTTVRWERTVEVQADRASDYLRIELPDLEPGRYAITISVSDAAGGSVTRERAFDVIASTEEEPEG
jgi:GWxTD domain-containing protein